MLECGTNFKGTMPEICRVCNTRDDENHRLNECSEWQERNHFNDSNKFCFDDIFSTSKSILSVACKEIEKVWELKYSYGRMKKR